jgi:peroxiredoxin
MTAQKTGASFTLLHDENYKISNAFDVAFKPDNQSRDLYNEKLNANLDQAHSDNSERLPIPATFILDQSGKVVWRHFNPNYKERASTQQILKVLDTLN